MDWAGNLFVLLLLTDVTGTIFFLTGRLFKRMPFGKDIGFLRFVLAATLCAFLIPFAYCALYLGRRGDVAGLGSDIRLFCNTPGIRAFNAAFGCIWISLSLALLAHKLCRRCRWAQICRGNIPEEDPAVSQAFREVSAELGVEGKVSLSRNDSVDMPCITYHHGFVVILPLIRYTEDEARVIFYHELCHYLNHDMYLKIIGCIVALTHVLNPIVHILLRQMDLLCEKYCDVAACKKGEDRFTREEYFRTILGILLTDGKKEQDQLFALADSKSNYEMRLEHMLRYHRQGGLRKGTAAALSVCFLLGSSVVALAAGNGVAAVYERLAGSVSVESAYDGTSFQEDGADIPDAGAPDIWLGVYDPDQRAAAITEQEDVEPAGYERFMP